MSRMIHQNGFTLVELVVAMGLFAVGLMGLCLMTSGLMNCNMMARQRDSAARLAQNALEKLSQSDYTEIDASLEENLDAAENSGSGVFRREVAVEEKTDPECKVVTVTVSWRAGGIHKVVLRTIFGPK